MRRMGWHGVKAYVKRFLGWRPLNLLLVPIWRHLSGMVTPQQTWRFPVNRRTVLGVAAGKSFRMLFPMRCSIAKELYWNKGLRESPADRLALDLFCQLARSADVVFDIGANTGLFAMAAAASNPETRIHAYEIVPDVVVHLVSNLVENEMLSQVEVHSYGIGSSDTTMRVPSQAGASALPSAFSSKIEFSDGARVMFQTLDQQSLFAEGASSVLLKIDVEGTENEILSHGNAFLARFSPDIICELLPEECKVEDVDSHLRANQYKCYKILPDRLQWEPVLKPDTTYHDWLFTALDVGELARRISPLRVSGSEAA